MPQRVDFTPGFSKFTLAQEIVEELWGEEVETNFPSDRLRLCIRSMGLSSLPIVEKSSFL